MHALVLFCINQYTKFEVTSFTNYTDIIGKNCKKNRSRDSDHVSLGWLVTVGEDLIQYTCMQNLTILASAVPEISLGRRNLRWVT